MIVPVLSSVINFTTRPMAQHCSEDHALSWWLPYTHITHSIHIIKNHFFKTYPSSFIWLWLPSC